MIADPSVCAACGEPARLHCADCDRLFCVEHLERRFAMGYFYLCAGCAARRQSTQPAASRRPRKRTPRE